MRAQRVDSQGIKGRVSMETVLLHYHVHLRQVGVDAFRGQCPLPTHSSPRSKNSFSVSLSRNVWCCQSASCVAARSGRLGGNVFDFVAEMERCSIREAALRLESYLRENPLPAAQPTLTNLGIELQENEPLSFLLRNVDHRHPYLRLRGLSDDTARYFGVGYYHGSGFLRGRVVIPIHNEHGQLVAYSGRATDGTEPKYRLPAGFRKSQVLYNLHRLLGREEHTLILVEGFFDAFTIHQAGHRNVAALMGARLSQGQATLIVTRFDRVVLMLDGDEAGESGAAAAAATLAPLMAVETVRLARGVQPDQLTCEEIQQALEGLL
jgi:DNA primase